MGVRHSTFHPLGGGLGGRKKMQRSAPRVAVARDGARLVWISTSRGGECIKFPLPVCLAQPDGWFGILGQPCPPPESLTSCCCGSPVNTKYKVAPFLFSPRKSQPSETLLAARGWACFPARPGCDCDSTHTRQPGLASARLGIPQRNCKDSHLLVRPCRAMREIGGLEGR